MPRALQFAGGCRYRTTSVCRTWEGLGLDSVDTLELGLAIQKTYGIKIDADAKDTRNHFTNVASLAAFVTARQAA